MELGIPAEESDPGPLATLICLTKVFPGLFSLCLLRWQHEQADVLDRPAGASDSSRLDGWISDGLWFVTGVGFVCCFCSSN